MILNQQTNGFLVFDMGDKVTSQDEAYAVTTTDKDIGPCARSVLIICKAEDDGAPKNDFLRYGQKIKLQANPYIHAKPLYLHSNQVSPQSFARFSRHQEVCLTAKNAYNTVWKVDHADPNLRLKLKGQPVESGAPILLEHCATCHYLASDKINYRNDFGMEFEVCVHSYATANKSQALNLEKTGKLTRE